MYSSVRIFVSEYWIKHAGFMTVQCFVLSPKLCSISSSNWLNWKIKQLPEAVCVPSHILPILTSLLCVSSSEAVSSWSYKNKTGPCREGATSKVNTVAGFPGSGNRALIKAADMRMAGWAAVDGQHGHIKCSTGSVATICSLFNFFW